MPSIPKAAEDRPRLVAIDPLAIIPGGPCPLFIPADPGR